MGVDDDIPIYVKATFNITVLILFALIWNVAATWISNADDDYCVVYPTAPQCGRSLPTVPAAALPPANGVMRSMEQ